MLIRLLNTLLVATAAAVVAALRRHVIILNIRRRKVVSSLLFAFGVNTGPVSSFQHKQTEQFTSRQDGFVGNSRRWLHIHWLKLVLMNTTLL